MSNIDDLSLRPLIFDKLIQQKSRFTETLINSSAGEIKYLGSHFRTIHLFIIINDSVSMKEEQRPLLEFSHIIASNELHSNIMSAMDDDGSMSIVCNVKTKRQHLVRQMRKFNVSISGYDCDLTNILIEYFKCWKKLVHQK
uniref:Uncharacterized protein n=1 Tax=Onchocerca volvulus TaxID=6282 RepID=A0A8R1TPN4_ONCVO